MSDPGKAVFLSYASQDAEAAKRICDALRAAGVEVWFDQSELVGGDAWDAKIRKQIKDCALLIPIISANTQSRTEGYFRLEWRLADQRTHLMGRGRTFLLPVCIDDTKDAEADVPDSFSAVQWTRLKGGETPSAFAARVQKLLSGEPIDVAQGRQGAGSSEATGPRRAPGPSRQGPSKWWWALPMFGVAMALLLLLKEKESRKDPAPLPVAPVPATGTSGEADQLVRQARELIYDPDSARNEFALAENLLKRATDLAPASGAAWGASALLNHYFYSRTYDDDRQRLVRSQAEAEKALRLDARNTDALLALGLHRQVLGDKDRAQDYLDRALAADSQNFKALLAQSQQLPDHSARAKFLLEAADRVSRPAELLYYAAIELGWAWRFAESKPVCERAIAAQPFWRTYVQRAIIEEDTTADPVAMNRWLDKVPESKRDEPRVAFMRFEAARLQRDGVAALRALNSLAADYLEDSFYTGPRALLLAQAHELAGQPGLAAEQWQLAERAVRERLTADPGGMQKRAMLAVSLAGQHRLAEAKTVADACAADDRLKDNTPAVELTADTYARLGEPDRAIELLRLLPPASRHTGGVVAANLGVSPQWDTLRDRPGYARLLDELKRAEHREGTAPAAVAPKVDEKSVAVLPFANLSDDKANEYFSDGISEELLNVLAKVPGLKVSARTSAFYFKGKQVPMAEIAQQLGVAYIVEGSVRKQGDKVRITAQLIKAADGFHVWSDTFTRDLKDIFAVQDEIAGRIASTLTDKLGLTLPSLATTNPEAYNLYLQARASLATRRLSDLNLAKQQFESVLALDPNYNPARAGLATTLTLLPAYNRSFDVARNRELYGRAEREARQVLERDPRNAEAWMALGYGYTLFDWRWKDAGDAFARALELAPNDAEIINFAGDHYRAVRDIPRMVAMETRALELNPLNPANHWDLAYACVNLRDYEQAIRHAQGALALSPGSFDAYYSLIWSLGSLKRFEEMRAALVSARRGLDEPESSLLNLEVKAAILEGRTAEALRLQEKITPYAEKGEYSPADHGYHYLLLGESEQAARWFKRACETRDFNLVFAEPIDLERIGADPKTRFVLEVPEVKELVEIRQRNARAAKGQK